VLTFAQLVEQHDLSTGKLQHIVVHVWLVLLTCRIRATVLPTLRFGKTPMSLTHSTSFSNAISVPGRTHTATFGSPTAAKPRVKVIESRRHQLIPNPCGSGCDEL